MTNTKRVMAACAVMFALTSPLAAQQADTTNGNTPAPATIMKRPAAPAYTLIPQEMKVADQTVTAPLSITTQQGRGTNVALMVVGGAAIVLGAVIGGDAGTLMMIGGAGVGLWGLYHYLR